MTDGTDIQRTWRSDDADLSVATLAGRALAVLASQRARKAQPLSERFVDRLYRASKSADEGAVPGVVTDLLHTGVPADEVLDFYIPEAARRLGDAWCSDGLGFADVTIASSRLQRALRVLSVDPRDVANAGQSRHSILAAVVPGEYHTLGAMVMTEQLRRMGVSVRLVMGETCDAILAAVATGRFDAIFFSVSAVEKLAGLGHLVEKSRRAAIRPTPIVIGGAVGHLGLEIEKVTGADHAATDPREALRLCDLTISPRGARRRATSG